MSASRRPAATRSARLACLALVMLSLVVLGGYWTSRIANFAGLEEATLTDLERRATALTSAVAEQTRSIVYSVDLALLHLQQQYSDKGLLSESDALAVQAATPTGLVRRIAVIDAAGYLKYTYPMQRPDERTWLGDRPHFTAHLGPSVVGLYIGHPIQSRLDGGWLIPMSRALRDRRGKFAGVVLLIVAPEYFAETYGRLAAGSDDVFALLHRDGTFMSRSVRLNEHIGKQVRADRPFVGDQGPEAGVFRSLSSFEPIERVFAFRRLQEWPLVVINGLGVREAIAPVRESRVRELRAAGVVSVLVLLLVGGICVVVLRLGRNLVLLTEAEERLELAFSGASEVAWEWHLPRREIRFFGDCKALIGSEKHELTLGIDAWTERIHFDDHDAVRTRTTEVLRQRADDLELQYRLRIADGSWHWVLTRGRTVARDAAGNVQRMIGILMDVDAHRKAEILAARTREGYARLIENAGEGIFVVDAEGCIEIFNPAAERLLGWSAAEVRGRSAHEILDHDDLAPADCPLRATLHDGIARRGVRLNYRSRDGRVVPVELSVAAILQDERPASAVVIVAGIAERLAWEVELERLARTDTLTDVNNRRYFVELVEREVQRAERDGTALAFLMLDLDYFKAINDRHGHAAGDAMLIAVARACVDELRQVDYFGRLGGEEFGVVLPGVNLAAAILVADRLRDRIAGLQVCVNDDVVHCTASIGVAERRPGESFDQVLARADNRLYGAKDSGRNRVVADLSSAG